MKLNITLARMSLFSTILFLVVFFIGSSSVSINVFSGVLKGAEYIFFIAIFVLVFISFISSLISFFRLRNKQSLISLVYSGVSFAIIVSILLLVSLVIPDLSAF